jgi:hypothetical protein
MAEIDQLAPIQKKRDLILRDREIRDLGDNR